MYHEDHKGKYYLYFLCNGKSLKDFRQREHDLWQLH